MTFTSFKNKLDCKSTALNYTKMYYLLLIIIIRESYTLKNLQFHDALSICNQIKMH